MLLCIFVHLIEIQYMVNHKHDAYARFRVAKNGGCFRIDISIRQSVPSIYDTVWNILCAQVKILHLNRNVVAKSWTCFSVRFMLWID
jgi:hypothetical protein